MDEGFKNLKEQVEQIGNLTTSKLMSLPFPLTPSARNSHDIMASIKPVPESHAEDVQDAIRVHITKLQDGLAPDEELFVFCTQGLETIRVSKIIYPNPYIVIFLGQDSDQFLTSFITNIHAVQLSCKIAKLQPTQQRKPIGFVQPTPQTEP